MFRGPRLYALLAIALLAAVIGFLLARQWFAPAPPPAPTMQPAVIPDRRPDVTLPDRDGKPRSLAEWDGRSLVVNFWATWCAPCRREIPMLNALARDYESQGYSVIGIAVDFREDVLAYMEKVPVDYVVLIGEQDGLDAAQAFGVETIGFPFTVFTDSAGRIVTIHVGEMHRPQADLILAAVSDVNAGRIDLPGARDRIREGMAGLDKPAA